MHAAPKPVFRLLKVRDKAAAERTVFIGWTVRNAGKERLVHSGYNLSDCGWIYIQERCNVRETSAYDWIYIYYEILPKVYINSMKLSGTEAKLQDVNAE